MKKIKYEFVLAPIENITAAQLLEYSQSVYDGTGLIPFHRFTIYGEPCSKSNSRRIVTTKGKTRSIKSQKALDYAAAVKLQAPKIHLVGDLCFTARLFYGSRRPALDASVLLDALENSVYSHDRQINELHLFHDLDREKPRAEIRVAHLINRHGG